MSLSRIGISSSPDIETLKKNIMYDALYFNIRQQQAKTIKKQTEKQKQIQEFKLINRRVSTQLNAEMEKAREKKNYIRNILAHDYEKQIQERKWMGVEEVRKNRSYAQAAQESQKEYHERRSREMARILRAQRTLQAVNPEAQVILQQEKQHKEHKRLKTLMPQPITHQSYQSQPQTPYNPHPNPNPIPSSSQIPDAPDSRISQPYKDYLMQQIQRKKQQREQQFRYKLEMEKQVVRNNAQLLEKEKEELREIQRKQRENYKRGLDQQVREKNSFRKIY